MTRTEWLQQLKVDDTVAIYFGSNCMGAERVTSAPASFVTIGRYARKVSFRRRDGLMVGNKPMVHWFHIERP